MAHQVEVHICAANSSSCPVASPARFPLPLSTFPLASTARPDLPPSSGLFLVIRDAGATEAVWTAPRRAATPLAPAPEGTVFLAGASVRAVVLLIRAARAGRSARRATTSSFLPFVSTPANATLLPGAPTSASAAMTGVMSLPQARVSITPSWGWCCAPGSPPSSSGSLSFLRRSSRFSCSSSSSNSRCRHTRLLHRAYYLLLCFCVVLSSLGFGLALPCREAGFLELE